jgi:cyclophilin family peptidyl-prolyl cis-trans isomerase
MSSPRPGDDTWFRPLYPGLNGDFRAFGNEKLLSSRIQPPNPFPPGEALAAVHLRGLVVDEVKFASGCDHMKPYTGIDPEEKMAYRIKRLRASVQKIEEWEKEANKPGLTTPYGTGKAQKDAFLLTLMVNRAMTWSKLESYNDEDCHRMLEIFMNREKTLQADGSQPEMAPDKDDTAKLQSLKSFTRAVVPNTAGRSFIITSKGFFGLAPLRTASGDIVCILEGGAVPFVLRKVLATELADYNIVPTEKQVYCILIGESYVHRVSDGNWVDQQIEDEIREFIVC